MNTKLLLNLCFIGCMTAITAHGSSLFDLKKLAQRPARLTSAVAKLDKYQRNHLFQAADQKIEDLNEFIQTMERQDDSDRFDQLANLAYPKMRSNNAKVVETAKRDLKEMNTVYVALLSKKDRAKVIKIKDAAAEMLNKLDIAPVTIKTTPADRSDVLDLYTGTPFFGMDSPRRKGPRKKKSLETDMGRNRVPSMISKAEQAESDAAVRSAFGAPAPAVEQKENETQGGIYSAEITLIEAEENVKEMVAKAKANNLVFTAEVEAIEEKAAQQRFRNNPEVASELEGIMGGKSTTKTECAVDRYTTKLKSATFSKESLTLFRFLLFDEKAQ